MSVSIPYKVVPALLPYLDAQELCSVDGVSKDFHQAASSNEGLWLDLCKRRGYDVGKTKFGAHTWKDVYKQMTSYHGEKRKAMVEYQERYNKWSERRRGFACGMRAPPPRPNFRKIDADAVKQNGIPAAFPAHPSSKATCVLPFSLDLLMVSKLYLDLLLKAASYSQIHDENFLSAAIQRYVNFLHLKHKYKNVELIPTLEIEYVWVSHMLRPVMYFDDCTKMFGEVIDHNIMLSSAYTCMNKANALEQTSKLYTKEFGTSYCSPSVLDNQKRLLLFNTTGIMPLDPPDEKTVIFPDTGIWSPPDETVSVECAHSFIGEIGDVGVSSTKDIKQGISLSVSDILMDNMWLGEFLNYMQKAVKTPTDTLAILENKSRGGSAYSNPAKMDTHKVYKSILKAYEKFLYMAAKYPPEQGKYVHPTYAIDVVWHSHMLFPKIYAQETKEWVGYLLDHEPWPKCDAKVIDAAVDETDDLWKKEYGCSIDTEHVTIMHSDKNPGSSWYWD